MPNLKPLDEQIASHVKDYVAKFEPALASHLSIATDVFDEVRKCTEAANAIASTSQITVEDRLIQMHSFLAWNAEMPAMLAAARHDLRAHVGAASLVVPAYYSFIYLKDSLLPPLAKLSNMPVTSACARFLRGEEIVALRHAFAHGNWRAPGNGELTYWARDPDDHKSQISRTITEKKLQFWLRLSRGFYIAALEGAVAHNNTQALR